ncbi:hypothetical protein F5Y19DRAFT_472602 [Xylariaceae sp. FL1651]|nr:hypothetical protein F5Y19DRAFT_472602 [Xylariaceae sp. FL1651]
MTSIETIFGELGISQYLGAFIDQGFDSWDTILDITESDLDALGVKLGHRRKLQRRIANYRGVAPDASLASPTRTSIEDVRHDSNRPEFGRPEGKDGPAVAKRKYRRHPKPDDNAPERPPSAYVLFSNKMREDLKGQNLTFTEIAKLVGENWQNLSRVEKEPFERQANEAKEKYNHDLAEYKKTAEYKKYSDYLHDFRRRQAAQTQEKDSSKRLKTDNDSARGSSTSAASIGPGGTTSGAGSGSESQPGSEPPPSRQQRLGSIASLSTGTSHADEILTSPRSLAHDESGHGRRRGLSSPHSRDPSMHSTSRRTGWAENQRIAGEPAIGNAASWLDPRGAPTNMVKSPEAGVLGLHSTQSSLYNRSSQGSRSSESTSVSQPPFLKKEQSSFESTSSLGSSHPPRTPSDASLPIHALLSSKPEPPPQSYVQSPPASIMNTQISQVPPPSHQAQRGQHQDSFQSPSHFSNGFVLGPQANYPVKTKPLVHETVFSLPYESRSTAVPPQVGTTENGLDGISALLRAREIVDRRP